MKLIDCVPCTFALLSMFSIAAAKDVPGQLNISPSDFKHAKTGLWEGTVRSESGPAPQMDMNSMDMSQITPEQRARVEAVLKRQHAQAKAQGNSPRELSKKKQFCVKQADLDRGENSMFGDEDKGAKCSRHETVRTASRVSVTAQCAVEGGGNFVSEMTFEVKSPTEIAERMTMNGAFGNHPVKSDMGIEAHWVGPDCGHVK